MKNELFLVATSKYNFNETVEKLSECILAGGWKILFVHDLQAILKKNGHEVLPTSIIEICKPAYSLKLLATDSLKVYSPLMPCRLSIYETAEKKVCISRMNSGEMAKWIGGEVDEVMSKAFQEIETMITEMLE